MIKFYRMYVDFLVDLKFNRNAFFLVDCRMLSIHIENAFVFFLYSYLYTL